MPIGFQSATTVTLNAGGNNAATVSVNVPAGTANGDMLIFGIEVSESAGVVPAIPGFTQKATVNDLPSGDQDNTVSLFWRRASSEPASYTVTPDGTYGNYAAMAMLRYTGVIATGDPFRTSATLAGNGTGISKTSTALTGVQSTDLAIHCVGTSLATWNGTAYDVAGPGGSWTERGEIGMTAGATPNPRILFAEQLGTGTAPVFTSTFAGVAWCFCAGALIAEPPQTGPNNRIFSTAVRRASMW